MGVLEGLEPARVFDFFEQISNIPRGSGNTAAMLDYLKNFAKERKLESKADNAGNIVIYVKGTPGYEKSSPVILQGHMDMVCAKRGGRRA
jgi:dipeptidase D